MTRDLELTLRELFAEDAQAVTGVADPWPTFASREAKRRRTRRVGGVVLAAALGVLVGVQSNLVPLPAWAPGIAVAGRSPAFADVPTRGSLAGEQAWLDALRQRVTDVADSDGLWKVTDRDDIHVIYAGDIPGRRVALLLVRFRLGLITSWSQVPFEGPPGAAPGQMEEGGHGDAGSSVTSWMHGDDVNGGAALVVGPPGATVTLSAGFDYTAAGRIERRQLPTANVDGVGVAALPPSPQDPDPFARVTHRGHVIFEGSISSGWSRLGDLPAGADPTQAMLAEAYRGAQGTPIDGATLASFVNWALTDSQLWAKDVTLRIWWSGQHNGNPAVLFTIQPRGGGVIAYAMHGDSSSWRTDLRLLLPADGAYTRPLAWRMLNDGSEAPTDRVHIVAPAGAARVTITIGSGTPTPVAIAPSGLGTTTVPPNKPATVTAFAADGTPIATTPVPPLVQAKAGLPGADRETRIVE